MDKKKRTVLLIFLLTFLTAIIVGGIFFVSHALNAARFLPGSWVRQTAVEQTAADRARGWLDAARMGADVPLTELSDFQVESTLVFNADGSWSETADESLYLQETERAYAALSRALKELIVRRAEELGSSELTYDQAEDAIKAATGLSSVDYLKQAVPGLLPSFEEIRPLCEGSGSYSAKSGTLTMEGRSELRFFADEDSLVLLPADGKSEAAYYRRAGAGAAKEPVTLQFSLAPIRAQAAENINILENLPFSVDGGHAVTVRTLHYGYPNNRYLSLRDVAVALNGTEKQFSLLVSNDEITIRSGEGYSPVGGENEPFPKTELLPDEEGPLYTAGTLRQNTINYNDDVVKYYTMIGGNSAGYKDAFFNITDLAMLMDLELSVEGGTLALNSSGHYQADLQELSESGFFDEVYSALVGDTSTGEIFLSSEEDLSVPIASTTKIMTYLIVMDAVNAGEISLSDIATVSKKAQDLSRTPDGVIKMDEGMQVPLDQLLKGMLLPSSNECALTLAEYIAGSEDAFVQRMNTKAALLGISEGTVFYNCHGLPMYIDNTATSKVQNHMSAMSMFKLIQHILNTYPQIREITSLKSASLPALDREVKNTNPMLYNLPGVFGLKTGTTNMSGPCLISAMDVTDAAGENHPVIAMEFGAEDATVRVSLSQELLLYGRQCVLEGSVSTNETGGMPLTAEELVTEVLKYIR
ncbi:MAG: serine hydrolase [Lachnospiraceae bacterium]|nr:serine hydrolase [Lachnospiraceae bacterium]